MVDAVRSVTICEVERTVGGVEGKVSRHKVFTPPVVGKLDVFALAIATGGHGGTLIPDNITRERQLGKGVEPEIGRDIEELFFALGADLDTVTTALKLTAEGADKTPHGVEDENAGVVLLVPLTLMHDVEVLLGIKRDVVSCLPSELPGE